MSDYEIIYTKPNIVKLLYQLMYDTHQILINNDIKYWATDYTLLGAMRNNGLTQWDDKLAIGMLSKDGRKLLDLEENFYKCGYGMTKENFGYRLSYLKRKLEEGKNYSYPFLSIILYTKKDNTYIPSRKLFRVNFPNEVHFNALPPKLYDFGEFDILGPRNPEEYLVRNYGEDWEDYDGDIYLEDDMLLPAEPMKVTNRKCVKAYLKKDKLKKTDPLFWMKKATITCTARLPCYKNFYKRLGTFVINCKMHKKRYDKFLHYAGIAGVEACRVPCVLGKKLSHNMICDMIDSKIVRLKSEMTPIEISINMSHYNCWQNIVNSCLDYGMILEDDVELKPDFVKNINLILSTLEEEGIEFSILHLWNGNWADTDKEFVMEIGEFGIEKEVDDYNAGAAAYIISAEFAKKMISKSFPIRMPQDMLLGTYYKQGNHLSLEMDYREEDACYLSPLLDMECGGEFGVGTQTTQEHEAPTINEKWTCDVK